MYASKLYVEWCSVDRRQTEKAFRNFPPVHSDRQIHFGDQSQTVRRTVSANDQNLAECSISQMLFFSTYRIAARQAALRRGYALLRTLSDSRLRFDFRRESRTPANRPRRISGIQWSMIGQHWWSPQFANTYPDNMEAPTGIYNADSAPETMYAATLQDQR